MTKHGIETRDPSLTLSFSVDQTPKEAFDAVNDVRGWWTGEIEGSTDELGDVFTYRYEDVHRSEQELIEVVPGKKVVWLVRDASLSFTKDKSEWKGTKIVFEISKKGKKTEIRFTHQGLVPTHECFDACSDAWTHLIKGRLRRLIAEGKGNRNSKKTKAG
jgi:hypothetical protein